MTGEENPFYEHYDEILEICEEHDVTISLGDACRPGCLADATDVCQIEELVRLGELTKRAWDHNVQEMCIRDRFTTAAIAERSAILRKLVFLLSEEEVCLLYTSLGQNHLNVTIGSALDLFGGEMEYDKVIAFCNNKEI